MFHKEKNRNSYDYFRAVQEAFPNVRAVTELPFGVFSNCFDVFVAATEEYREYRQELAEKAEKREA